MMSVKRENLTSDSAFNLKKFIRLLKEFPIPSRRQSKVEVDETWALLERQMKVPRAILERKRQNLVSAYRRELRLELATGDGFVSKWPHFRAFEFMREDILRRMQPILAKPGGFAAGKRSRKMVAQQSPGETSAFQSQWSQHQEQQLPSSSFFLNERNFPIADASSNAGTGSSQQVYDFLMTRILPQVSAMPLGYQMAVLGKMQQMVFEVDMNRRSRPAMPDRLMPNIFAPYYQCLHKKCP